MLWRRTWYIYNARVDFVNKLEKLENVEIKEYNPDVKMPGNVEYKKPEIKKVDLSAVPYLRG